MTTGEDKLAQLTRYCARGMRIFPCFEVRPDGACACHEGLDCRATGKHPRVQRWDEVATTDVARVTEWHARWPAANWAWALDAQFVIDDDPRNGGLDPTDFHERWEEFLGFSLAPTLTQRTGGGGLHLVYAQPPGVEVRNGRLRFSNGRPIRGIEVKGVGGYVVVAPSNHRLGHYAWVNWNEPIGEATAELLALYARPNGRGSPAAAGDPLPDGALDLDAWAQGGPGVPAGEQRPHLLRGLGAMRRRGYTRLTMITMSWSVASTFTNARPDWPWTERDVIALVDDAWERWESAVTPGQWQVAQRLGAASPNGATPAGGGGEGGGDGGSGEDDGEGNPPVARDRDLPETGTGADNPHRSTDRANGIEIARFLDGRALWVPESRVGWQWYVFDGRRWLPDRERIAQLLVGEYTDALRREATTSDQPADQRQVLMARATRIESAAGLSAALVFAGPLLAQSVVTFDRHPWLLNCPNGTLELRTGELRPHDARDLLTRLCPTPHDPDARDEVWERVLREALEGDEDRLRVLARFTGYTLTGHTGEKKFAILSGPKDTGKSTVAEAIFQTLGDVGDGGYATTWDADVVQARSQVNRGEKLAKARPARMVLVGELERGSRMADNFVKRFTGGDTMDARALYESSYSYRPQGKLWMATNYVPGSADPAVHGRLLPVPFQHVPRRIDRRVKEHLDEDVGAHRAVLAWAVRSCRAWRDAGSLGEMPWLNDFLTRYVRSSDHVADFIEQRLAEVGGWEQSSSLGEVFRSYEFWAVDNVHRPLKQRKLNDALEEHGLRRGKGTHGGGETRWIGRRVRLGAVADGGQGTVLGS